MMDGILLTELLTDPLLREKEEKTCYVHGLCGQSVNHMHILFTFNALLVPHTRFNFQLGVMVVTSNETMSAKDQIIQRCMAWFPR